MFLGLITILFLIVFSLLYISKALGSKSESMTKAVNRITDNLDQLAFWGVIYGLIATVLCPILISMNMLFLFVSLLGNITLIVLALPFAFERFIAKKAETMNAAILENLREIVVSITAREKILGYVGGGVAFLMLAVMFS